MKQFFYSLLLISCASFAFAQNFTISDLEGNVIPNGGVLSFSEATYPNAKYGFHCNNTSASTIKVFMKIAELVNNDGTKFETCFGSVCVNQVTQGQIIPQSGFEIQPSSNNGDNDFWINTETQATGGNFPIEYKIEFFELDQFMNPVGEPYLITYRYAPDDMDVEDVNKKASTGVNILQSVIKDNLSIELDAPTEISVFSLEGSLVKTYKLGQGVHNLPMQYLAEGVYIIQSSNSKGNSSKKIIKK